MMMSPFSSHLKCLSQAPPLALSAEGGVGLLQASCLFCRLNYRLTDKCEADIDDLCSDACNFPTGQACGGRVLRCLTNKQDQVKSKVSDASQSK